jgi:hypothetical protein
VKNTLQCFGYPSNVTKFSEHTQKMIHFTHTASTLNNTIYIFGGLYIKDEKSLTPHVPNNDLLQYNPDTKSSSLVTPNNQSPLARNWHSSIVYNNELYIFGGKSNGYLNDMWKYDPVGNMWTQIQYVQYNIVPSQRYGHKCVVIESEMYVYGGYDSNGFTCGGELYVFNLLELTWRKIELSGDVPAPCYHHTMCAIPEQNLIVIFGGIDSSGTVFDQLVVVNSNDGICKAISYLNNINGIYGHSSFIEKGSADNHWNFHVIGGCSKFIDLFQSFYFNINIETLVGRIIKTNTADIVFNNDGNRDGVQRLPTFSSVIATSNDNIMVYGGIRNKDKMVSKAAKASVLPEFAQTVPDDIAIIVLSFMNRRGLCTMRRVSKSWNVSQLSEHNLFWKPVYQSVFKQDIYSAVISDVKLNEDSITGYKQAIKDLRVAYKNISSKYVDARKRLLLPERKTPVLYSDVSHQYVGKDKLKEMFHKVKTNDDLMQKFGNNGFPEDGTKFVTIGDGAVGKTSLLIKLCTGSFPEEYVPTAFDNFALNFSYYNVGHQISVWDTAGPEEYDRLR